MNDSAARKVSGWKIAGVIVGTLVLCVAVLWIVLSVIGTAKLEKMLVVAEARRAEMKALDPVRPTLRGASEPGNAFDDYMPAMDAVKAYPDIVKLGEILRRTPKADPELGKTALAGLAKAIEQVHHGAGRATSRYPYEWDKGFSMPTPHLSTATNTVMVVVLKARALSDEGKGREAAGLLVDCLQFGRDMGADGVLLPELIGYAMMGTALDEIRGQLAEGRFDKTTLEDLDRALATLDQTLPDHGRGLVNDLLLFGGMTEPNVVGGWGPLRLLYASSVEQTTGMMTRAAAAESVSWTEIQKVNADIEAEAKKTWNPITKIAVPGTLTSSRNVRVHRAHLQMLRVALRQAAGGELLDLDDPFGTKLKTSKTRIWSVGPDGVDDGGVGEWKNEGKDLVLELKK